MFIIVLENESLWENHYQYVLVTYKLTREIVSKS